MQVREGKAVISVTENSFYNPKMQKLRDISVSFLNAVGCKDKTLLDATAATGIRAIRYAKECGIREGTALDMNKKAYNVCKKNIKASKLKFSVVNQSIQEFANTSREKFDIIDLDPFGSPAPCIYDIMKLSRGGTLLMITATDTAVLCGAHAKACLKLYNAKPLHNELCKEVGLRILIGYIARTASQFNFGIRPMLSISDMHYMRAFIELKSGASVALESLSNTGLGAYCNKCMHHYLKSGMSALLASQCKNCKNIMEGFGPLWIGKLYDKEITRKMLKSAQIPIIKTINAELDAPMFYSIPKVTRKLGLGSVSHYKVIEALKKAGNNATTTQFDNDAIKTEVTAEEISRMVKKLGK